MSNEKCKWKLIIKTYYTMQVLYQIGTHPVKNIAGDHFILWKLWSSE